MRLISWNLWHGLSGSGLIKFGELESKGERETRYQTQCQIVKQLEFDFFCAQEVNPLEGRVDDLTEATDTQAIYCYDNSGLKYKGFGFPLNLNSGLAIFYRFPWECIDQRQVQLSGDFLSSQNSKFSAQVRESRYALVGVFQNNETRSEVVVANLHLHHGFQWQESVLSEIEDALPDLSSDQWNYLREILARGDIRRTQEITCLLEDLKQYTDIPVIVAGDFNSDDKSVVKSHMIESGFKDVWQLLNPKDPGVSWDPQNNEKLFEKLKGFKSDLQFSQKFFSKDQVEELRKILGPHESRARRIDHIYVRDPKRALYLDAIRFFANKPGPDGNLPSDHFGLQLNANKGTGQ